MITDMRVLLYTQPVLQYSEINNKLTDRSNYADVTTVKLLFAGKQTWLCLVHR